MPRASRLCRYPRYGPPQRKTGRCRSLWPAPHSVLFRINAAETETSLGPDRVTETIRLLPKAKEEPVQDILVVDDDPSFADYITTLLRRDGYSVTCVDSGEKALEHLAEHPCRVVITDVLMPDMDGIELLREIGQRGLDIAVIGITVSDEALKAFTVA